MANETTANTQLCDPPRPSFNSTSEEISLKKIASNTDSGVFEGQSSIDGSPDRNTITIAELDVPTLDITPIAKISDIEEEDSVFDKTVIDMKNENNNFSVGEKLKTDEVTDLEKTIVYDCVENQDSENFVESEAIESDTGDYETDSQVSETPEEKELRDIQEFQLAQSLKFHTPWRMYFVTKKKGQNINAAEYKNGRQLYPMIYSIAEFWGMVNNIPLPTELKVSNREDYYFFRGVDLKSMKKERLERTEGIEPEWEDESAKNGGIFRLELMEKEHRNGLINNFWFELLIAVAGEQFTDSSLITGVVFSRRQKEDRFCIWTRDLSNEDTDEVLIKKRIADEFRKFLGISEGKLEYISHEVNKQMPYNNKSAHWGNNKSNDRKNHQNQQKTFDQAKKQKDHGFAMIGGPTGGSSHHHGRDRKKSADNGRNFGEKSSFGDGDRNRNNSDRKGNSGSRRNSHKKSNGDKVVLLKREDKFDPGFK